MKTILITGCNGGIGKSILDKFIKNKHNVIACFRKETDSSKKLVNFYKKKFKSKFYDYYFDITKNEDLENTLKKIIVKHKKIDVVINNAGLLSVAPLIMTGKKQIQNIFETNFFSLVKIIQLLSKKMIYQKSGVIINIASTSGIVGDEGRASYSASKAAVINLSKTLSKELGRYNIRVNSISPGLINSKMLFKNTQSKLIKDLINRSSLKRIGEAHEIANVAFFLSGESSSYITGQNIIVDGGLI